MQGAVAHGIAGIVAECGGNAMCATCHVYTAPADADKLPEVTDDGDEMLDCTSTARAAGSRLSCQPATTTEMDGLVVRIPAAQQ
jgi:2Fe-2S ferredoxin